jgi:hypothetical protein
VGVKRFVPVALAVLAAAIAALGVNLLLVDYASGGDDPVGNLSPRALLTSTEPRSGTTTTGTTTSPTTTERTTTEEDGDDRGRNRGRGGGGDSSGPGSGDGDSSGPGSGDDD